MGSKILTNEEMFKKAKVFHSEGKTIVTTNGSFDVLHSAHLRLLEKAREQGDVLFVLLNDDSSIQRAKGSKRPIIPEQERAYMLSTLGCIDHITIFTEDTPIKLLKEIKPNIHVKGGSVNIERMKEEQSLVSMWGGEFRQFDLEEGFSTTNIISEIIQRHK